MIYRFALAFVANEVPAHFTEDDVIAFVDVVLPGDIDEHDVHVNEIGPRTWIVGVDLAVSAMGPAEATDAAFAVAAVLERHCSVPGAVSVGLVQ